MAATSAGPPGLRREACCESRRPRLLGVQDSLPWIYEVWGRRKSCSLPRPLASR